MKINGLLVSGLTLLTATAVFTQEPAVAGLKLSPVFGSHAVLQSGMPVPVWGTASPGSEVTVSFAEQTVKTTAGENGRWKAVLQPLVASSDPQKMIVKDFSGKFVLDDLLVGEVWLVCGRSNIGFSVARMDGAESEQSKAAQPLVRLMKVGTKDPSDVPLDNFTTKGWFAASPAVISDFSAVGWVFGSELQKARKVPVGIVQSSWGGSPANMWIESPFYESHKTGDTAQSKEQKAFEKESQQYHKTADGETAGKVGNKIGSCFNSHIHPLIPMAMKGAVIFFDGSPADDIRALAQNWRGVWGQGDFPYIFIQVHRQGGPKEEDPNQKSDANRAGYISLLKTIPNSAMAVALDCGVDGEKNIHPPNKRPVGERVALAARALACGEKIVYSGPVFSGVTIKGSKAVLSFEHTGSGLMTKGDSLEGFAVTADGQTWNWGEAVIEGDHVIVTSPSTIKAVRYAWGPNNPKGNLFNREGLPASPFITQ